MSQYRINYRDQFKLIQCCVNIFCRKVREAPVEAEENKEEIEVKESYKSKKESKKEAARAEKYNKKEKIKQAGEEPCVTKEKKKPKEQVGKACKQTKAQTKPKRQTVKEDVETEVAENNEEESEGEESLSYSSRTLAKENELEVVTVPSKSCKIKNDAKEDTLEEDPDVLEDEEESAEENVPAKKCYYK